MVQSKHSIIDNFNRNEQWLAEYFRHDFAVGSPHSTSRRSLFPLNGFPRLHVPFLFWLRGQSSGAPVVRMPQLGNRSNIETIGFKGSAERP